MTHTLIYQDEFQETTIYFNGIRLGNYLSNTLISIKIFDKVINDKGIESVTFFGRKIKIDK